MLRPGNVGSNTATDHIEAADRRSRNCRLHLRRRVLVRTDSGGGTHEFLAWLTKPSRRLAYSAGFAITEEIQDAILKIPASAWTPTYDSDRQMRPGAWVAELTGMVDLSSWPRGMRVIVRKERPTPALSCASPTWTATASPAYHQHQRRAARRPGAAAPPPGPLRGPDSRVSARDAVSGTPLWSPCGRPQPAVPQRDLRNMTWARLLRMRKQAQSEDDCCGDEVPRLAVQGCSILGWPRKGRRSVYGSF